MGLPSTNGIITNNLQQKDKLKIENIHFKHSNKILTLKQKKDHHEKKQKICELYESFIDEATKARPIFNSIRDIFEQAEALTEQHPKKLEYIKQFFKNKNKKKELQKVYDENPCLQKLAKRFSEPLLANGDSFRAWLEQVCWGQGRTSSYVWLANLTMEMLADLQKDCTKKRKTYDALIKDLNHNIDSTKESEPGIAQMLTIAKEKWKSLPKLIDKCGNILEQEDARARAQGLAQESEKAKKEIETLNKRSTVKDIINKLNKRK